MPKPARARQARLRALCLSTCDAEICEVYPCGSAHGISKHRKRQQYNPLVPIEFGQAPFREIRVRLDLHDGRLDRAAAQAATAPSQ
jgi:hypothetical protein